VSLGWGHLQRSTRRDVGDRKGVKRCWGEERRFVNGIQSVREVEVVFDVSSHGGIGSLYSFLLSGVK